MLDEASRYENGVLSRELPLLQDLDELEPRQVHVPLALLVDMDEVEVGLDTLLGWQFLVVHEGFRY